MDLQSLAERGIILEGPSVQGQKRPSCDGPAAPVGKRRRLLAPTCFSQLDVVAIDCEMVEVTRGKTARGGLVDRVYNALARCSIVDVNGNVIYDEYIRPRVRDCS